MMREGPSRRDTMVAAAALTVGFAVPLLLFTWVVEREWWRLLGACAAILWLAAQVRRTRDLAAAVLAVTWGGVGVMLAAATYVLMQGPAGPLFLVGLLVAGSGAYQLRRRRRVAEVADV